MVSKKGIWIYGSCLMIQGWRSPGQSTYDKTWFTEKDSKQQKLGEEDCLCISFMWDVTESSHKEEWRLAAEISRNL